MLDFPGLLSMYQDTLLLFVLIFNLKYIFCRFNAIALETKPLFCPNWLFFACYCATCSSVWSCVSSMHTLDHHHLGCYVSLASGALITSCCLDQCWLAAGSCEVKFLISSILAETEQTSYVANQNCTIKMNKKCSISLKCTCFGQTKGLKWQ